MNSLIATDLMKCSPLGNNSWTTQKRGCGQKSETSPTASTNLTTGSKMTVSFLINDTVLTAQLLWTTRTSFSIIPAQVLKRVGPCNCTYGVTASATFNAMLNITDQTIPRNSGCYRPIQLIVPPGTVVNVKHPGPSVGGNSEIHERIVDVLFGCLSGAVPRRVAAATGASSCNFLFGGIHPNTDQYYANYHIDGCGWGGKATGDGNHTQCPINGNCRNTPVEVFETRYPLADEKVSHRRGFGRARTASRGLWQRKSYRSTRTRNHSFELHGQA